jgi:hypothetical protein
MKRLLLLFWILFVPLALLAQAAPKGYKASAKAMVATAPPAAYLPGDTGVSARHPHKRGGDIEPYAVTDPAAAIQTATITLTSTQITSLATTPVQVVAAPGAGNVILPLGAYLRYRAGTVPYFLPVGPAVWRFFPEGNADDFFFSGSDDLGPMLTAGVNMATFLFTGSTNVNITEATLDNRALMFGSTAPTEFLSGDGTLTLTVYYTVLTLT